MTFANLRGLGLAMAIAAATFQQLAATPARAQEIQITIDNFTFSPKELKVKAGTTVTWTNHDDIPHGIASSNNAFAKSKALDTDDSYSFTFTAPGTYQCFCYIHSHMVGIHSHMVGSIIVEATTGSNASQ